PAVTCATRIPGFGAISMDCHSGRRYDLSVETAPSVRSSCRGGTSARPFRPARRAWEARPISVRPAPLSLPYLSPDRGECRRSPSTSVESFLTVRSLGFPREFGFGVRRRRGCDQLAWYSSNLCGDATYLDGIAELLL